MKYNESLSSNFILNFILMNFNIYTKINSNNFGKLPMKKLLQDIDSELDSSEYGMDSFCSYFF